MARFTNQAQLRYGNSVANSNVAVGEILEVLSAAKKAVRDTYSRGDKITYIISIVNSGTVPFSGLTLTDNLGETTSGTLTLVPLTYITDSVKYYIDGILQASPAVTPGPPLAVSGLSIPAGGNAVIVYEAAVNQYAPLAAAGTITNTAVLSGTGVTPITVTETVQAENAPDLSITKSISPVPVTENGTLTYTFLIQNFGNAAAAATAGAVITDTFDPVLSNLAVSFDGTAWAEPANYTYDETSGEFATVPGQIIVPAATYTQDPVNGVWTINPGVSTLTVTGTI